MTFDERDDFNSMTDPRNVDEANWVDNPATDKIVTRKLQRLVIAGLVGAGLTFVIAIVLVGVFGLVNLNRATEEWTTFRHPSGLMQIDLPGTPQLKGKPTDNSQTYWIKSSADSMEISVAPLTSESRMGLLNPSRIQTMWKTAISNSIRRKPDVTAISTRILNSGIVPGAEATFNTGETRHTLRMYLVPQAIVAAEFMTPRQFDYEADEERFFRSFCDSLGMPFNGSTPKGPARPNPETNALVHARHSLSPRFVREVRQGEPVLDPPEGLAKLVEYPSPAGLLKAYVTNIPRDGQRRPAIIWISGGDCHSISNSIFTQSDSANDQSANAFWRAGIVTMYPSLRGGNDNPGHVEGFLGEVEDVIAAADYLAQQEGIDPARIYLGGHSTGGTLTLLTAEVTDRFRAVFSLGPAADLRGYGQEYLVFDTTKPEEFEVRTPARWLGQIRSRTIVMEGIESPGNIRELVAMSSLVSRPGLIFLRIRGADHFSLVGPATKLLAEKILRDVEPARAIQVEEAELDLSR